MNDLKEDTNGVVYVDKSTVAIVPTRGMVHFMVAGAWMQLQTPLSFPRMMTFAAGMPVAEAYNELVKMALEKEPAFILTLEDDNLPPPNAHLELLRTIGNYDAISGLYYTKDEEHTPLIFNDDLLPATGFTGTGVVKCGGIPMGCALWRASLFREIPYPWFVTDEDPTHRFTHDLYFAQKMARHGKTCAVNLDVRVGHIDVRSGIVY
jgi:hypothetical protein